MKQLCENDILKVPKSYILPIFEWPNSDNGGPNAIELNLMLLLIDVVELQGSNRPQVLKSLANACEKYGGQNHFA